MSDSIRAVRNNNPGNIEKGDPWQGLMPSERMSPDQAAEERFCVFESPQWGFRALAVNLITYQDKYGIRTITAAIMRWAPPSENDTKAYIRHVVDLTELSADKPLSFHDYSDAAPIVKAIATHECGGWFFDEKDLDAGLKLAGVLPPSKALVESRTVKASTVAAAATSISIIAETVTDIRPMTGLIGEVAEYAPTAAGILVLVLLGAIIYFRFDTWRRDAA